MAVPRVMEPMRLAFTWPCQSIAMEYDHHALVTALLWRVRPVARELSCIV